MHQRSAQKGRSLTFWIALTFFALLSTLWALASPVYSVADENAHATKAIAQLRGQVIGYEVEGIKYTVVDLPDGYRYSPAIVCFVYQSSVSADCATEVGDTGTPWFNTWVGAYNPTYYYLVGWPSLLVDGNAGIYAMRIASAMVGSLFLAWATQVAMSFTKARWMPLGVAFLASPMIIYFMGSVNPQGLEVASSASLWLGLLALLGTWQVLPSSRLERGYLWTIVALSAGVLANVRALGPLWVVVIIAACLIVSGWKSTKGIFTTSKSYWWIAPVAVAGLFSSGWTLVGGSLSQQAGTSDAPLVGASFLRGFGQMLRMTPLNVEQAAGYFGWLDAPLPSQAQVAFFVAFAIVVVLALVGTDRRGARNMTILIALAIFVPALVQGYSVGQTGLIWQGRYGLFLYIGIAIVAVSTLSSESGRWLRFLSVRMTVVVVALLSVYGVGAFVLVLRRYVVGNDQPITQMLSNPQWQPPLGWPVLVALMVLTWAAFASWIIRGAVTAARLDPVRALRD